MHAVIDKYESDVTAMLKGQQAKGPREVKKKNVTGHQQISSTQPQQ